MTAQIFSGQSFSLASGRTTNSYSAPRRTYACQKESLIILNHNLPLDWCPQGKNLPFKAAFLQRSLALHNVVWCIWHGARGRASMDLVIVLLAFPESFFPSLCLRTISKMSILSQPLAHHDLVKREATIPLRNHNVSTCKLLPAQ